MHISAASTRFLKAFFVSLAFVFAACAYAQLPFGDTAWRQTGKIVSEDRTRLTTATRKEHNLFGNHVAISGDYAVVGGYFDSKNALGSDLKGHAGAAFVFKKINGQWKQMTKLLPADRTAGANFGRSVAISGDYIFVGAHAALVVPEIPGRYDASSGAVYIFHKDKGGPDGWGQIQKIEAPENIRNKEFGRNLAVSGNYFVTSAAITQLRASDPKEGSAVYIFQKQTGAAGGWKLMQKIAPPEEGRGFKEFGYSLAISKEVLAVGSFGNVYLYHRRQPSKSNWQLRKTLKGIYQPNEYWVSPIVALHEGMLVVGAPLQKVDTLERVGKVYVFAQNEGGRDHWGKIQTLQPDNRQPWQQFGSSVAIDGNQIAVGASNYDRMPQDAQAFMNSEAGAVYIFKRAGKQQGRWQQETRLMADAHQKCYQQLGRQVAISGNTVAGGAEDDEPYTKMAGSRVTPGAVYFFTAPKATAKTTWSRQKAVEGKAAPDQLYGSSAALDGDFAVVGAPGDPFGPTAQDDLPEAGAAFVLQRIGGRWKTVKRLTAPDRFAGDGFGTRVAISGTLIAVYAFASNTHIWGDSSANLRGSIYLFSKNKGGKNNWGLVRKIAAPDGGCIGYDLFLNDTALLVGSAFPGIFTRESEHCSNGSGAVYVFHKNAGGQDTWGLAEKLSSGAASKYDGFGSRMAQSGNTLIASATADSLIPNVKLYSDYGAVFVFQKDTAGHSGWQLVQRLIAPNLDSVDYFGAWVTIYGNTLAIAARYTYKVGSFKRDKERHTHRIYLFSRNDLPQSDSVAPWQLVKEIVPPKNQWGAWDAIRPILWKDQLMVGAYGGDEEEDKQQRATYVFRQNAGGKNNWGLAQEIKPTLPQPGSAFGFTITTDGKTLLIGAPNDTTDAHNQKAMLRAGAVYIFNK